MQWSPQKNVSNLQFNYNNAGQKEARKSKPDVRGAKVAAKEIHGPQKSKSWENEGEWGGAVHVDNGLIHRAPKSKFWLSHNPNSPTRCWLWSQFRLRFKLKEHVCLFVLPSTSSSYCYYIRGVNTIMPNPSLWCLYH